jgi:hypothetical protein
MADSLIISVAPDGKITCIYDDALADLFSQGVATIRRASNVEPHPGGGWIADMSPSGGGILYAADGKGFPLRQQALDAERAWLEAKLFGVTEQPKGRPPELFHPDVEKVLIGMHSVDFDSPEAQRVLARLREEYGQDLQGRTKWYEQVK